MVLFADDGGMLRRLLGLPHVHRSVPLRSLRRYVNATASASLRVAPVPVRAPAAGRQR